MVIESLLLHGNSVHFFLFLEGPQCRFPLKCFSAFPPNRQMARPWQKASRATEVCGGSSSTPTTSVTVELRPCWGLLVAGLCWRCCRKDQVVGSEVYVKKEMWQSRSVLPKLSSYMSQHWWLFLSVGSFEFWHPARWDPMSSARPWPLVCCRTEVSGDFLSANLGPIYGDLGHRASRRQWGVRLGEE